MVFLRNCSFENFIKRNSNKKIVFCGAGKNLRAIFQFYSLASIRKNIQYIVDNNSDKYNTLIHVDNFCIQIKPVKTLRNEDKKNLVLLITPSNSAEIIQELDSFENLNGCEAYIFSAMDGVSQTCFFVPEDLYSEEEKIPKILHFCWFGKGTYSLLNEKCLASWRKYCPDFTIMRWDENNYDVKKHVYMRQAYEAKKWGFVADYAKLDIIYHYGGIHMDTDVEILKPLHPLLRQQAFCGRQRDRRVALGLGFGAVRGNEIVKQWLEQYDGIEFCVDGKFNLTTSPTYQTEMIISKGYDFRKIGFQKIEDMMIYPAIYFDPFYKKELYDCIAEKSFSFHHYEGSWNDKKKKVNPILLKEYLNRLKCYQE